MNDYMEIDIPVFGLIALRFRFQHFLYTCRKKGEVDSRLVRVAPGHTCIRQDTAIELIPNVEGQFIPRYWDSVERKDL